MESSQKGDIRELCGVKTDAINSFLSGACKTRPDAWPGPSGQASGASIRHARVVCLAGCMGQAVAARPGITSRLEARHEVTGHGEP